MAISINKLEKIPELPLEKYAIYERDNSNSLPSVLTDLDNLTKEINKCIEKHNQYLTDKTSVEEKAQKLQKQILDIQNLRGYSPSEQTSREKEQKYENEKLEHKAEVQKLEYKLEHTKKQLSGLLMQLAQHTKLAEDASFLQTHPDINQWTSQAAKLQEAFNRQWPYQRHDWIGGADRTNPSINPDIDYDPNAIQELESPTTTRFYKQLGHGNWQLEEYKAEIEQVDGSKQKENVQFSALELQQHLIYFCDQKNITIKPVDGEKQLSSEPYFIFKDNKPYVRKLVEENKGKITFKWNNKATKEAWLEHLKAAYQQKRQQQITGNVAVTAGTPAEPASTTALTP